MHPSFFCIIPQNHPVGNFVLFLTQHFEGLLVLCAGWITPVLTDEMLHMFSCAGALITIPIGTNMMGITKVKIADLIPVLVFAPVLAWITEAILH